MVATKLDPEEVTARAAALRKEYHNKWNQENKDKVKAAQQRYWERKARQAMRAEAEANQD